MTVHARSSDFVPLGGFNLLRTTGTELQLRLQHLLDDKNQHALFFANTNFIVQCQTLQKAMNNSNTIIVNDGIGVDIAAWLIHRQKFPENLNGTDFVPAYLHSVRDRARIFLFGGKPDVAARAAQILQRDFGVNVVGTCDGYAQANPASNVVAAINHAQANIVLVATGNPAQEQWILEHRHEFQAPILMGVGALLDFLAGDKPRAPALVQRLRLEWLYRLCLEPTRLLRRYTVDIAVFLALCLRRKNDAKTISEQIES